MGGWRNARGSIRLCRRRRRKGEEGRSGRRRRSGRRKRVGSVSVAAGGVREGEAYTASGIFDHEDEGAASWD